MTQPAILEQWSAVRSRSVSRSDHTNPTSMEHFPCCKRRIWCVRICSFNWSITSSKDSTMEAVFKSSSKKACSDKSIISLTALEICFNSDMARSVKARFFPRSSSADSKRLTAWSDIRSKSPMILSSFAACPLSSSLICLALSFTRYVPRISS